jgi:hypothetical protein
VDPVARAADIFLRFWLRKDHPMAEKKKKLQVKDLAGKKLTAKDAKNVKGGRPAAMCLVVGSQVGVHPF